MKTLPDAFSSRMKALLGQEYSAYEDALSRDAVRAFRVNTQKLSLETFQAINPFSRERIPYVDTGYYLDSQKVGNHPYHHAGMIYVQDPGAMAPAECLDVQPDWRVLDLCAAPGGKSSQVKNKLGPSGLLVSNELIPARCKILTGNVERLGLTNTAVTCAAPAKLAQLFPEAFDLVLVDAPCSGEGMFRKGDEAISQWSVENVLHCARRQTDILEHAAKLLKPGGYLLYATCTHSIEENEMVIDRFLQTHPEFLLTPVKDAVAKYTSDGICFDGCTSQNLHLTRRFYPHKSKGEGQFMALLHHQGTWQPSPAPARHPVPPDKQTLAFLDEVLEDYDPSQVTLHQGRPIYAAPALAIENAFSRGVTIGELRGNRIQPHHQFFSAMGNRFRRKIHLEPDDPLMENYLRGEEIPVDCENGWAVVMTQGCALGGVKVTAGRGKNHYPKGLRKRGT